jgi:hypothetical protein
MNPVTTVQQLEALKSSTLVWAAIICVAAFAISFLIATHVPYKGGKDTSYITRRIWYIVIGVVSALGYWIFNFLVKVPAIKNPGFQSQFSHTNLISVVVVVLGYVVLGLLVALIFRKSKFSTVYIKHKK